VLARVQRVEIGVAVNATDMIAAGTVDSIIAITTVASLLDVTIGTKTY
jgi:hypothetical protein